MMIIVRGLVFGLIGILMLSGMGVLPNIYADTFVIFLKCVDSSLVVTVYDQEGNGVERAKVQTIEYINSYGNYEKRFYTDNDGKAIINNNENTGYIWVLKSGFDEQKMAVSSCGESTKKSNDQSNTIKSPVLDYVRKNVSVVQEPPKLPQINTNSEFDGYTFSMDYQCPSFTDHTIVYDETRDEDKYFLELNNNVNIQLDVLYSLQQVPEDLKVVVSYSDGSSLDFFPTTTSIQIPAKNNDAKVTKFVATSEKYTTSEIDYACSSSYATQFTLKTQYDSQVESDRSSKIAANYCNELVYGCNASYDIKYDLNSENDFVKKMWTDDNSLLGVNKIDYDFTSANRNYFNFDSKIHSNDFSESTHVGSGNFEIGSQFIYPNNYDNNPNNMWDEEQVTMSIAGFNRNAVHYWSYVDLGITPYGDAEIQKDYYYDIDTGILLKFEQFRSLLDVSGKQNTEKILIKASSINFPKNTAGGGCLIATATYGSELSPQVQQLRELRDNSLLQTESGANFMGIFNDVYYSFSPVIADYERENPIFKEMVKITITPMITSLSILNYVDMDSEESVLGYGISLILLNGMMYVGIPILAVMRFRK